MRIQNITAARWQRPAARPSGGHQPAEPGLSICTGGICLLPCAYVTTRWTRDQERFPEKNSGAAGPSVCG